ncbi:MAG TPA: hypothetical protein VK846_09085 [Candidatus Limnocylindria bacterium]|nr:hypothetical protein [Candidatus Limnocylindria bacterium]
MKWTTLLLSAWFAGAAVLYADDDQKPSGDQREGKTKEGRKTNSSPARAEWEKRREQLEKMTPEEREAKRQELKGRLEKRICDLRSKATNGIITPQEKRELERREQVLKRFEQSAPGGVKGERAEPKKPAAPAPQ